MRIAIIGTSGSGKTTLARMISQSLGICHIEIDAFAWSPGWVKNEDGVICETLQKALEETESWVACGNYRLTREIVWNRATHIVWLHFPLYVVIWRALKRTLIHIFTKKEIAGGNRETFYRQFLSKNSIFVWIFKTHWKRKREYLPLLTSKTYPHLKITILKSQKEVDEWLKTLQTAWLSSATLEKNSERKGSF